MFLLEDSGGLNGLKQESNQDLIKESSIQLEKTNNELSEQLSLLEKDRTAREQTITQLKEKALSSDKAHLSQQYLEKTSEQLKRLEQARDQLEHEMQIAVKLAEEAEISGQQLVKVEEKIEKEETKIEKIEVKVEEDELKFKKELDFLENENLKSEEKKEVEQIAAGFEQLAKTSGEQNDEVQQVIKSNENNDSLSEMEKIDDNDMKSESHLYENPQNLLKIDEPTKEEEQLNDQQLINEETEQQTQVSNIQQQNEQTSESTLQQNNQDSLYLGKEVCSLINIRRIKLEHSELKWNNDLAFLAFLAVATIQKNADSINNFMELEIIDSAIKSYDEDGYVAQLVALVPENNSTFFTMDAWEKEQFELLDDDYDYCIAHYKNNLTNKNQLFGVALLIKSNEVNKQALEKFTQTDQQFINLESKVKEDPEYEQMANQFHNPI